MADRRVVSAASRSVQAARTATRKGAARFEQRQAGGRWPIGAWFRRRHARCRRRAPQREKAPRALGGSKQAGDGRSARGFGSVTLGAGGARRATQPSGTPTCRRSPSCCRGWGLLRRVWVAAAPGGGLARARGGAGLPGQNLKKKGCCSGAAARAPRHTSRTLTRDTPPRPSPPTPRLPAVPCSWSAKKNRTYAEFRALEP